MYTVTAMQARSERTDQIRSWLQQNGSETKIMLTVRTEDDLQAEK